MPVQWDRRPYGTPAAWPRAVAPYGPRGAVETVLHGIVHERKERPPRGAIAPAHHAPHGRTGERIPSDDPQCPTLSSTLVVLIIPKLTNVEWSNAPA